MCNSKCLYCYGPLKAHEHDFHAKCARYMFGTAQAPELPYSRSNLSELALKVIQSRMSVMDVMQETGVPLRIQNRIIDQLIAKQDEWYSIIEASFLTDDLKTQYKELIAERLNRLVI